MSIQIEQEKLDILTIKIVGNKTVHVKFFDMDLPNRKQTNDDGNLPHEDLLKCIRDFGPDMADALGIVSGWNHAIDHIKKNEEALKKAVYGRDTATQNCKVDSVSFFGEKRESIELSGPVTTDTGTKKQTTARISLNPDLNEQANELLEKVAALKTEVWAYLFADKFVKSEKKKKQEIDQKATETFEKAIDNGGVFESEKAN